METAQFTINADRLILKGHFNFYTVPHVWSTWNKQRHPLPELIDCQEVLTCDSAVLALLLSWFRIARQEGITLCLTHLPKSLHAMLTLSKLDCIFQVR